MPKITLRGIDFDNVTMEEAVSLDDISKVSLNSDYNFTDPDTKRYRYQAIFNIWYYE